MGANPLATGELAGRRVLVTGARGFIGSHLVPRLLGAGADLHYVSRNPPEPAGGGRWWRADVGDRLAVERLFQLVKPDLVYHLAGHVTARPEISQVVPTFASLLSSTVWVLLESVNHHARRVVVVGSAAETQMHDPDPAPGSPYVAAKWAASGYARMFHALYGAPVVIIRPAMTYGPGQPREKLVPAVAGALLRNECPPLSSGQMTADWAYIDDVAEGLCRAGHVAGIEGSTLDLGSGKVISVRDLVAHIVRVVAGQRGHCPEPQFGALPDRPHEGFRAANADETSRRLGWRATTSLDDGLRRTVYWLSESQPGADRRTQGRA